MKRSQDLYLSAHSGVSSPSVSKEDGGDLLCLVIMGNVDGVEFFQPHSMYFQTPSSMKIKYPEHFRH